MERRFDMTDFEQSLKEHADQFVMIPSKRVWQGIYNNLHPGSRWPSITVAIAFLFTLIGINQLNAPAPLAINSSENTNDSKTFQSDNQGLPVFNLNPGNKLTFWKNEALINFGKYPDVGVESDFVEKRVLSVVADRDVMNTLQNATHASSVKSVVSKIASINGVDNNIDNNVSIGSKPINKVNPGNNGLTSLSPAENNFSNFAANQQKAISNSSVQPVQSNETGFEFMHANYPGIIKDGDWENAENNTHIHKPMAALDAHLDKSTAFQLQDNHDQLIALEEALAANSNQTNSQQKSAVRPARKRNSNISWVYFINPTMGTAFFNGTALRPNSIQNLSPVMQTNQAKNMIYHARPGYGAGAQMAYRLSKKWQFITGANISYSGYNVVSNQVHPTFAYLMLNEEKGSGSYAKSYITHFGNGEGQNQIKLLNVSVQAAVPFGLQYELWSNSTMRLTVASSIAPSFVLKSDAFILSADGRNYVSDPTLLRKFNLNSDMGSYITFSAKKIKWQIGPNIRYQVLSTYKNEYPVKEHLFDYGMRIGISK